MTDPFFPTDRERFEVSSLRSLEKGVGDRLPFGLVLFLFHDFFKQINFLIEPLNSLFFLGVDDIMDVIFYENFAFLLKNGLNLGQIGLAVFRKIKRSNMGIENKDPIEYFKFSKDKYLIL